MDVLRAIRRLQWMEDSYPAWLALFAVVVSLLPLLLGLLGLEFGNQPPPFKTGLVIGTHPYHDHLHQLLSGSFTHTLLEWSAFTASVAVALTAFAHYSISRDVTVPILALAILASGFLDAFHTLAADRLIEAVAPNQDLVPFSWAISRFFNAAILVGGIFLVAYRRMTQIIIPGLLITVVALLFIVLAYLLMGYLANSALLPQTYFPQNIITRPWDLAALMVYLLLGVVVLPWAMQQKRNRFYIAIGLSLLPHIMAQLHMVFGSVGLFDHHFNIAHFLKIFAYLIPFLFLLQEFVIIYREEKRLRMVLGDSEEKFNTLARSAQDAIILINSRGRVIFWNRAAEQIFGYSSDEVMSQNIHQLLAEGELLEKHKQNFPRFAESGEGAVVGMTLDLPSRHKDGRKLVVELSVGAFQFSGEWHSVGVARDVTSARAEQEELKRHREQLEEMVEERSGELLRSNRHLLRVQQRLERRNRELQEFAYVASHDLREPLRKIEAFSGRLENLGPELDERHRDYLQRLTSASQRMSAFIGGLLRFSRVETTGNPFEEVVLDHAVAEALSDLEVMVKQVDGEVEYDSLGTIEGDPAQLQQLFQNLISNSLKYHREGVPPRVRITSELLPEELDQEEPERMRITVEDNGIGFEERDSERIFTMFVRLQGRSEKPESYGIGLAVAKRIVERHGGEIEAHGRPGEGAIFILTLPTRQPVERGAEPSTTGADDG